MNGDEIINGIEVSWNKEYESNKKLYLSFSGTKEEVLQAIQNILPVMIALTEKGINYFNDFNNGNLPEQIFFKNFQQLNSIITKHLHDSSNIPLPTFDTKDYYEELDRVRFEEEKIH